VIGQRCGVKRARCFRQNRLLISRTCQLVLIEKVDATPDCEQHEDSRELVKGLP
jgi:hypothetical protein